MGALTAFAVRALRQAAWLARQLGTLEPEAATWEAEAEKLAAAFRAELFDPARGIFRDGCRGLSRQPASRWLPPDGARDSYTRHTNILAVWAGIVTSREVAQLLSRVLADPELPEPQPYFQHYLFEALAGSGLFGSHAGAQLALWRPMLEAHPYSLREMWNSGDYSHAWGGTPLVQCSRRILGVEPLAPGWRSLRVCPHPLTLDWARGVVPTPRGPVRVEWRRQGERMHVRLELPTTGARVRAAGSGAVVDGWTARLGVGEELYVEFD
jgi:hypothetical protein